MAKNAERIEAEELYEQIRQLSPEPFRNLLGRVLDAEPTPEAEFLNRDFPIAKFEIVRVLDGFKYFYML